MQARRCAELETRMANADTVLADARAQAATALQCAPTWFSAHGKTNFIENNKPWHCMAHTQACRHWSNKEVKTCC